MSGRLNETATNGGRPLQKVINEGAVEDYLNRGWRYVGSLNGGKVIVEKRDMSPSK